MSLGSRTWAETGTALGEDNTTEFLPTDGLCGVRGSLTCSLRGPQETSRAGWGAGGGSGSEEVQEIMISWPRAKGLDWGKQGLGSVHGEQSRVGIRKLQLLCRSLCIWPGHPGL